MNSDFSKADEILDDFDMASHLDHIIRLSEKYLHDKNNADIDKIIKESKDQGAELTDEQKDMLKNIGCSFHIHLEKEPDLPPKRAYVFMLKFGAQIYYSTKGPHQETHRIICHEIAHRLLHYGKSPKGKDFWRSCYVDGNNAAPEEAEATYFADKVLKKLSDKFNDSGFIDGFKYDIRSFELPIG